MESGKVLEKRTVVTQEKKGMTARDMLLIGILLAAGAVLKFFVGSFFNFAGMKPNFVIAMYCLIILLIKPKLYEAAIIGLLAGFVCQFFPGQPYLNFASELVGAVAMSLLIRIPMNIRKFSLHPIVSTFLSTLASGFTFVGVMYFLYFTGYDIKPTPLGLFLGIILGTALFNSILVQILHLPLSLMLKKR